MIRQVTEELVKSLPSSGATKEEIKTLKERVKLKLEKQKKGDLTFKQLREADILMTQECFPKSLDWDTADWMLALVGELGELANFFKKRKRGEQISQIDIDREFADVMFYLDKLANHEEVDLETVLREKYNYNAEKYGSKLKL